MKLLNIFALIATTMVVSTEAVTLDTQIEAPQQEESIGFQLAEVNVNEVRMTKAEVLADVGAAFDNVDLEDSGEINLIDLDNVYYVPEEYLWDKDWALYWSKRIDFVKSKEAKGESKVQKSEWLDVIGNFYDSQA